MLKKYLLCVNLIPRGSRPLIIYLVLCISSISCKAYAQEINQWQAKLNPVNSVKTDADSLRLKSPMGAAFRSLLIPGLGQFYNGKKFKGLFVVVCEGVLIYLVYNENKKIGDLESADSLHTDYKERRNTMGWWFFSIVGISMVDAYVDAYLDRFNADMDISVTGFQKGYNGLNVCFRF